MYNVKELKFHYPTEAFGFSYQYGQTYEICMKQYVFLAKCTEISENALSNDLSCICELRCVQTFVRQLFSKLFKKIMEVE